MLVSETCCGATSVLGLSDSRDLVFVVLRVTWWGIAYFVAAQVDRDAVFHDLHLRDAGWHSKYCLDDMRLWSRVVCLDPSVNVQIVLSSLCRIEVERWSSLRSHVS